MPSTLFSPLSLRQLTLANRIAVSPMCQYGATDGAANDWHLMHLGQFAMGAAGLVFAEATHVSAEGRISPRCLGLYDDAQESALERVIDFCHRYGVAAFGLQLAHAGRKGSTQPPQQGGQALGTSEGAWTTVGPSALPYAPDWHVPRELDSGEIGEIKAQFVAATRRAQRIGFDLLELHAAHGYLLHQFLSPISNHREDGYGGSLEGRLRLPLEIFKAVRQAWPEAKPLGVRVSATDWVEGGWTLEETLVLARELQALGCDFIDVSSGGLDPRQEIASGPGYQVPFAARIRAETGLTAMAVGMITEPAQAEAIVASGQADLVAMARAMMFDPRWAWHAARALGAETPYAERYMRCHPSSWRFARSGPNGQV